jgi:hypothetical protein
MKNITLSLDEKELERARRYAQEHGISLNSLIRSLLARTVPSPAENWLEDCFELMDQANPKGKPARWKREDLYDV